MKKKLLTNKIGQVRELTQNDLHAMRPAYEVLPLKEWIKKHPRQAA
jgi:hypothetical protein